MREREVATGEIEEAFWVRGHGGRPYRIGMFKELRCVARRA